MEKEKKETKEMKKWPIIVLVLFLILIIGSAFAWFILSINGTQVNVIKAGSLSMELDDEASEGILIQEAVPMSYRQGMETVEYEFTLKNNSQTATEYTISLVDESTYEEANENGEIEEVTITDDKKIEDTKIRYILLKNDEAASAEKSKLLSDTTDRIIDSGRMIGTEEIKYTLRVWIDSKAGNEVMDKIFNARLRLDAVQAPVENEVDPEPTPVGPFYAFGTPTTESATDYTTLGYNVFAMLDSDNSLGVCINNGGLFCIKTNDYDNTVAALKAHFGEDSCTDYGSNFDCHSEGFDCSATSSGGVFCIDNVTRVSCDVIAGGSVSCF